jgi:hypothetical protein
MHTVETDDALTLVWTPAEGTPLGPQHIAATKPITYVPTLTWR